MEDTTHTHKIPTVHSLNTCCFTVKCEQVKKRGNDGGAKWEVVKNLTNLRSQLYSAADYFEFTYTNEECKQIVADTLKDYAIKALVNTVDHLGSASFKVDRLLNDNTDEVVEADLRVSCIEQRLATFQECIDLAGFSQQSLVIATPKYHKRYVLPIGESMPESGGHAVAHVPESHIDGDELRSQTFQDAIRSTIVERTSSFRRGRSRSMSSSPQSARCPTLPETFARSGSISNRPTLPEFPPGIAQRFPAEIRKSTSVHLNRGGGGDGEGKELVKNSSKTKGFLMSLLKKHKVKKDEMLYTYLDEY
ncbi:Protein ABIL2 [Zostera marina]|uniref:Protein ABIL2 n=1 Tax=Zostera marina TaxID=29655 RepID=A0A0K9P240_ZOSMR|nr:Protein ABIL2 [Zostera marina]